MHNLYKISNFRATKKTGKLDHIEILQIKNGWSNLRVWGNITQKNINTKIKYCELGYYLWAFRL